MALYMATRTKQEERVAGVRWVKRKGEKVLQQYWSIKTFEHGKCIGMHGEWRDVPTEKEEK